MSMTKAEKAEMDALRVARDMARSLRWPEYPTPVPMTIDEIKADQSYEFPTKRNGSVQLGCAGWSFNSYQEGRVFRLFSNGVSQTQDPNGQSWSQGAGRLYRTEVEALQALRLAKTEDFAQRLAEIDAALAEAAS